MLVEKFLKKPTKPLKSKHLHLSNDISSTIQLTVVSSSSINPNGTGRSIFSLFQIRIHAFVPLSKTMKTNLICCNTLVVWLENFEVRF